MARLLRMDGVTIHYPESFRLSEDPSPDGRGRRSGERRGEARRSGVRAFTGAPTEDDRAMELAVLLDVLGQQEISALTPLELRPMEGATPAAGKRRGAAAEVPEEQTVALDVALDPGQGAVVLVEQDGAYSWIFPAGGAEPTEEEPGEKPGEEPGGEPGRRARAARTAVAEAAEVPSVARFSIPIRASAPAPGEGSEEEPGAKGTRKGAIGTRGLGTLGKRILLRPLQAVVLKFAARKTTDLAMKLLERRLVRGLVVLGSGGYENWQRIEDPRSLAPLLPAGRAARVLLFVHGTFSSTAGSFGPLMTDPGELDILAEAERAYDLILGFDHPTLSETPVENAVEMLRALEGIPWPQPPVFDAVAYSRGGLVLRSLIETLLPAAGFEARFEKAIFVAATNGGTRLAEPSNWHSLLDLYTNLALAGSRLGGALAGAPAAGQALGGVLAGIGAFVKYLATHAVTEGGIPGLAAMEPDGPLVTRLNTLPQPPGTEYFAITSNFNTGLLQEDAPEELGKRFTLALADRLVDRLMGAANDLVVDVGGMKTLEVPENGALPGRRSFAAERVHDFGDNARIYHTVYFLQPKTREKLGQWLGLEVPIRSADGIVRLGAVVAAAAPERSHGRATAVVGRVARKTRGASTVTPKSLKIAVEWGDIRRATGDIYAVGHYQGVMPVGAEAAIDQVLSDPEAARRAMGEAGKQVGKEDGKDGIGCRLVLAQHTRRDLLQGRLGEVEFFPWASGGRLAAVCGKGYPGIFGERELRLFYRNLIWAVACLPSPRTLVTILTGIGRRGLPVEVATRGLLQGLTEALRPLGERHSLTQVRIVEYSKARARHIHRALQAGEDLVDFPFTLEPEVVVGQGGGISSEYQLALLVAAAAKAQGEPELSHPRGAVSSLLGLAEGEIGDPETAREALATLYQDRGQDLVDVAGSLLMQLRQEEEEDAVNPTRLSYISDFIEMGSAGQENRRRRRRTVRVAAITDSATVPERDLLRDPDLVAEVVRSMTDPPTQEVDRLARFLHHLVVPRDFRGILDRSEPLIFELDRHTAAVHWEMLGTSPDGKLYRPVALERQVARQLRTAYATTPTLEARREGNLRALLIGDPGDPAREENLPGAQEETLAVRDLLAQLGLEVHVLVGAPNAQLLPGLAGSRRATRATVLEMLMSHDFDLVHYAGHGDFDPEDPSWVGWLFHDGLLTAAEIELVDRAPTLIVANACLSARLSEVRAGGGEVRAARGEAALLPSLADEFFRRGVRHYVGTAWEVSDEGAVEFARVFYRTFLGFGKPLGEAMFAARRALAAAENRYGTLWAAYQHYGDPRFTSRDLRGGVEDD